MSPQPHEAAGSYTPARLALILRRQWWLIVACMLVAALGAVGYAKSRPTSYLATRAVSLPQTTIPIASNNANSSTADQQVGGAPASILASGAVQGAADHAAGGSVTLSGSANATSTSFDITAQASSPAAAVRAANAAAAAFASSDRSTLQAAANQWNAEVRQLQALRVPLETQARAAGSAGANAKAELGVNATAQEQAYAYYNDYIGAIGSVIPGPAATAISGTSRPSAKKALELALAIGLVVGAALALVREQMSVRVRSEVDLDDLGVPMLAQIPFTRRPPSPVDVAADSHSALSESVRELRTRIRFVRSDRPIRVLLVTSAEAGEGKSFVAANLAAAWATAGEQTVLVSSDMRRPTIEDYFGGIEDPSGGLSEALLRANVALRQGYSAFKGLMVGDGGTPSDAGSEAAEPGGPGRPASAAGNGTRSNGHSAAPNGASAEPPLRGWRDDLARPTGVEGLSLVCAGYEPPNPTELLGSMGMAELLGDLRERADLVILDSPPVLAVTDALVLTEQVDAVVMVFARGRSNRRSLDRALDLLSKGKAPVVGAVLNRSAEVHIEPSHYYYDASPEAARRRPRRGDRPPAAPITSA